MHRDPSFSGVPGTRVARGSAAGFGRVLGDHHCDAWHEPVTTFVRTWFGRGTASLARPCDPQRWTIGLTPEVGGRSSRPNHVLTDVVTRWSAPRSLGFRARLAWVASRS